MKTATTTKIVTATRKFLEFQSASQRVFRHVCHHCGVARHVRLRCYKLLRENHRREQANDGRFRDPTCYRCGVKGHVQRQCFRNIQWFYDESPRFKNGWGRKDDLYRDGVMGYQLRRFERGRSLNRSSASSLLWLKTFSGKKISSPPPEPPDPPYPPDLVQKSRSVSDVLHHGLTSVEICLHPTQSSASTFAPPTASTPPLPRFHFNLYGRILPNLSTPNPSASACESTRTFERNSSLPASMTCNGLTRVIASRLSTIGRYQFFSGTPDHVSDSSISKSFIVNPSPNLPKMGQAHIIFTLGLEDLNKTIDPFVSESI
ncbi:unnamed protein product [Arabis nemorensis]|uniref:CCHC-type domain-containing protein n=1 Tax=Arabis nemorensis TaxID=586526 RepID=A0A565C5A9_9BRAS|nr:unnamed protein product [Arabis nemorensis]